MPNSLQTPKRDFLRLLLPLLRKMVLFFEKSENGGVVFFFSKKNGLILAAMKNHFGSSIEELALSEREKHPKTSRTVLYHFCPFLGYLNMRS